MEFTFTPVGFFVLALGALIILFGPRRWVIPTILFLTVFISMRNRIIVGGLDFMMHRLVVILGWLRLILRSEYKGLQFGKIDKAFILLVFWSFIAYTVLWGTTSAFIYRSAVMMDTLGLYFLFRALLRSWSDLESTLKGVAVVTVLLAGAMAIEFVTRRNPLTLIGGVPEEVWNRKGKLRCQAGFGHPISAGVFGATLLPIWLAAWWSGGAWRKWGLLGIGTSTVITGCSASSSSALAFLAGGGAMLMWPLRNRLRQIRWGTVATLCFLHLIMTAPVWALVARMNVFGGSTGYYRFLLMDRFFKTFPDWWLMGVIDIEGTLGLWDMCNQFVLEGVRGGLLRLALFLAVIGFSFQCIGRLLKSPNVDLVRTKFLWGFGAVLFSHTIAFLGYDYWDQILVLWYFGLAAIASLPFIAPESITHDEQTERVHEENYYLFGHQTSPVS